MSESITMGSKMKAMLGELVDANADAIAAELTLSPTGKGSVGFTVKLARVHSKEGHRVYLDTKLSYSRKFTDEREDSFTEGDPNQMELGENAESRNSETQEP